MNVSLQAWGSNFEKLTDDRTHDFKETITPASAIPSKVFVGFQKACHLKYKFDSKTEKDFSILIEEDGDVAKWMRGRFGQLGAVRIWAKPISAPGVYVVKEHIGLGRFGAECFSRRCG